MLFEACGSVHEGGVVLFFRMKLRVRVQQQDSRLELPGEEPSLTELVDLIKVSVLSSRGLRLVTTKSVLFDHK